MQVQNSRQGNHPTSHNTAVPFTTRDDDIAGRSHGTIRLTEPCQVDPNAGSVVTTDEEPQGRISLLDLPSDLFLQMLGWLEMPDIFNLRRACQGLKTMTQLHATWVVLATQHVIRNDLPWPAWALPLSEVPSATLEHLTLQALRMRRLWDCSKEETERKLSRFIQRPRESITWIYLILSRWLLIQQSGTTLELWDLEDVEYKRPTLSIDSFEGIVDGSVVRSKGDSAVTVMISTRSFQVGRIEFSLPYPKADRRCPSARVVDSFANFSRLMDANEQLAAFLQHNGNNGKFVRDMSSGAVACLGPSHEDSQPQQAFAIQIKHQVVAVATSWSLDLYWRETILTTLQSAQGGTQIQPFQRLTYIPISLGGTPKDTAIASALFLANNSGFTALPSGEDTIFLCAQGNLPGQILHVAQLTETTPKGPPMYRLLPRLILFWSEPYTMLFYGLGQSGRRSVFVVDDRRGLSLCGISLLAGLSWHEERVVEKDWIGWWRITDRNCKDLVHHVAFEEATGTCAVAMGSGRVWVADLTASEMIAENTSGNLGIPVETVIPLADLVWPGTHPFPWPAVISKRDPDLAETSSEAWCADVETYYPSKNRTDCFGGVTWFVNEALNIPGSATSLFFNVPTRFRFSPAVEIIGVGDRLLVVQRWYDDDDYSIVLLSRGVQLDDVIKRLVEGDTDYLPGNEILLDPRPLGRYAAWRGRIQPLSFPHMW